MVDSVQALLAAVGQHPEGVGLSTLAKKLPRLARRTAQRRLSDLVKQGRLLISGQGRAVRYQLAPSTLTAPKPKEEQVEIRLSTKAVELTEQVRRPLSMRKPVGYQPDLLRKYEPNASAYLSSAQRRHLHGLGRTPMSDRPAGTYARQIFNRLLVDLSWASSRLEGNTYSRLDTENLIRFGRSAEGKDTTEAQMILNHKTAIELLVDDASTIGFNRYTFQNVHALLSENLMADASASGRLRTIEVGITGTVYQPSAVPQLLEEQFDRFLKKASAIDDPFEQAFFTMVQVPYLQPFEDMNKRVSRLGANISLIQKNLVPLSFVDVPDRLYIEGHLAIYELNRIELLRDVFVWAYERSCLRYSVLQSSLPAPDPFRSQYREAIIEVVSDLVRSARKATSAEVRKKAKLLVRPEDLNAFVALVEDDLRLLHEGSIARYRLRLGEFQRWAARTRS